VNECNFIYSVTLRGKETPSFESVAFYDKMSPDSIQVAVWRNKINKMVGFNVVKRHDIQYLNDQFAIFTGYICGLPECSGNNMVLNSMKTIIK